MPDQPTPARADDVPDEWVRLALVAWFNDGRTRLADFGHGGDDCEHMADAIAAVVPAIQQAERAKVTAEHVVITADDLAELLDYVVGDGDVRVVRNETLDRAFAALKATLQAEITRGEAP